MKRARQPDFARARLQQLVDEAANMTASRLFSIEEVIEQLRAAVRVATIMIAAARQSAPVCGHVWIYSIDEGTRAMRCANCGERRGVTDPETQAAEAAFAEAIAIGKAGERRQ